MGSIAQQQDDLNEAETRYTRALEINPYFATALANRGEVRLMQGRLTEGAQDLIKAIEADPKSKEPATVRAQATLRVLQEQLSGAAPAEQIDAAGQATTEEAASPTTSKADASASRLKSELQARRAESSRLNPVPRARRPSPRKK